MSSKPAEIRGGVRAAKPKVPAAQPEPTNESAARAEEQQVLEKMSHDVKSLSDQLFSIDGASASLSADGDQSKAVASTFNPPPKQVYNNNKKTQQMNLKQPGGRHGQSK